MTTEGKLMMTSEADGTFTITRIADEAVLGRMTLDDFSRWHAWRENAAGEREYLGVFEDDGDGIAAIEDAAENDR
ncbi:hypothetical protein [Curtobacterium sp. VKM Ac-1376]|uniref:hypothetical protein n=1 Tax=Curtobacterium sp. VKM Ac-1376 TaxID=123312 RepID=UPI00188C6952|nr:hypothetical protein [Curtobacterium sp. VKM Ac-1376]MBF4613735.1 hypothetical protein [Curtobacterium sp. VKM Ac-1376]